MLDCLDSVPGAGKEGGPAGCGGGMGAQGGGREAVDLRVDLAVDPSANLRSGSRVSVLCCSVH